MDSALARYAQGESKASIAARFSVTAQLIGQLINTHPDIQRIELLRKQASRRTFLLECRECKSEFYVYEPRQKGVFHSLLFCSKRCAYIGASRTRREGKEKRYRPSFNADGELVNIRAFCAAFNIDYGSAQVVIFSYADGAKFSGLIPEGGSLLYTALFVFVSMGDRRFSKYSIGEGGETLTGGAVQRRGPKSK